MPVTAHDVAQAAGVSISTVSRALSAPHLVATGTRKRVERAVAELGYEPNRAAQLLSSGATKTLGLIVPDLQNPYFAALAKGIQTRAWEAGYVVIIADSNEDLNQEDALIATISAQVDGLILSSGRSELSDLEHLQNRTELVLVNREVPGADSVSVDNDAAMQLLARHLMALGHTKIAYLGGPRHSWSDAERRAGLTRYAQELGFELIDIGPTAPTQAGGYSAGDLLLASGASAGICFNDLMAVGALKRLQVRGVRVPQEFSLAGIDNIAIGTAVSPTLTTVGAGQQQLGREATDLLLQKLATAQTPAPKKSRLAMELTVRDSTGPRS